MKYTSEQLELGRKFRNTYFSQVGPSKIHDPEWEELCEQTHENWTNFYFNPVSDQDRKIRETVDKENNLNTAEPEHSYDFVSTYEGIDFVRIVKEAPKGTPFILVEAKTKQGNHPIAWALLIHNDVLSDNRVEGYCIHEEEVNDEDKDHISPEWGDNVIAGKTLYSYRHVGGEGRAPGRIKQQIETIKSALNPKDVRTKVTLL